MAARATRSASRDKARLTEAVATGPLGALSHDELGVIFDGLADPLEPVVATALSSTCLGLRTPLRPALEVLKERHERAAALCRKCVLRMCLSGTARASPPTTYNGDPWDAPVQVDAEAAAALAPPQPLRRRGHAGAM